MRNPNATICPTKSRNFSCAHPSSAMAPSSYDQSSWMVTRRRSKAEERREEMTAKAVEESVKACADCRTSNTPLWRSGPNGPMSLCNACGIRYRKRKRRDGKEEAARELEAITGKGDGGFAAAAVRQREKLEKEEKKMATVMSEEEMRRRQREKQEKILMVLQRQRIQAARWRRRWLPVGSAGGGDSKEVADAALLLLSLSSGISVNS